MAAQTATQCAARNPAAAVAAASAQAAAAATKGLNRYWLVMDMDGTVLPTPSKAGGQYRPLSESPCEAPLKTWLRRGGNLAVVSTAGRRMWRQVHEVLKPATLHAPGDANDSSIAPGRLVIGGFSGAALFVNDPRTGNMVEDPDYRSEAVPDGTCPTAQQLGDLIDVACTMIKTFLLAALRDDTLIPTLSKKYHAPYARLLEQLEARGEEAFFSEVLTRDVMLKHGAVLSETNDALVDVQTIPHSDPVAAAQVTVLGIPMKRFHEFFTPELVETLEDAGLHVKSQPNSVCIVRSGVDKATFVRWMCLHGHRYSATGAPFSLRHAIAFGDNPAVVDRPLTIFPDMAFVSLAPDRTKDPEGSHIIHVGNEEVGCANFLRQMIDHTPTVPTNSEPVSPATERSWWEGFADDNGNVSVDKVRQLAATADIGATPTGAVPATKAAA